ncbi:hypothetical protein FS837_010218 [Tulasnella sp. UAMH 9824]|nr:hypothetical protein FS837_010218 [Tulasnella sp. UAMH 9824]
MVTRTIEPGLDETELGRAFLMSVPYREASYKNISAEGTSSLEELADTALQLEVRAPFDWRERHMTETKNQIFTCASPKRLFRHACGKQLSPNPLPVNRARLLNCCSTGATATLAVNGRENRRCACVVEESGQVGEVFDIDAEGDDEEDDEEEAADGDEGGSQAEREEADGMEE